MNNRAQSGEQPTNKPTKTRSTTQRLSVVTATLMLLTGSLMHTPGKLEAQEASLAGTWQHRGGEAERERRHDAIDRATEDMGLLMRGRARNRLRDATAPESQFTVSEDGDSITLSSGGNSITLSTDGSATTVSGDNGEATMRARWRNGRLVVSASHDNGSRTIVYHLSEDGDRLTLVVRITSDRLGEALSYRVSYRRD